MKPNNKNIHTIMESKFNKKKTIQNDLLRIHSIHKKPNRYIPIVKNIPIPQNNEHESQQTIYNFDNNTSDNLVRFNVVRENDNHKIPKIILKEISIPTYSDNDKFDLNKINRNISKPIHMDIFASDIINDGDVNRLKKKKIKKIIHIYQEKYADDVTPTGFGDFIRSCFFIIQFAKKYDFHYEIIINHPIAHFLKKYYYDFSNSSLVKNILNNKIYMFTETNWSETVFDSEGKNFIEYFLLIKQKFALFVNYLCSLPVINHSVISYNILFPYDTISTEECNIVRSFFEPSREMELYIDETLTNLAIIKNKFIVIHIRSGDSYLKNQNKIFGAVYFEIIKNEIIEIIFKNNEFDILLIADNNEIKLLLKELFPKIKFIVNDITHLGEGVQLERENVKNTLLDFYLMSNAFFIHSFTSYPHGSGFSYWCSKIYDIPYKCKYIKPN